MRLTNNAVFAVLPPGSRSEKFVLRVHRPNYRTPAQTQAELALLDALASGDRLRIPRPVRARNGELVITAVDGARTRHCDVLTWVDGEVRRPTMGLGPRGSESLGRTLGLIHRAAEAVDLQELKSLPRWDADTLLTAVSPFQPGSLREVFDPQQQLVVDEVTVRTRAVFDALDQERGSMGIIHFDYILGNCRLRRRAGRWDIGVIDFDDCGWGYHLYDIAPMMGNLADFPGFARMGEAFLRGYRAVRPLTASAEVHLPTLMAARHVVSSLWVASVAATNAHAPAAKEHTAYRVDQARRCLALAR